MTERLQRLRENHLVETKWLADHLDDPGMTIVDMRGYVKTDTTPDGIQTAAYLGARQDYEEGHIPGAVYLDWTTDIVNTDDSVPAQVAIPEKISKVFGSAGIGDDTLVIAYDNHPASQFATRLWWVMRYYDHESVRVLNGGWAKWVAEGRPITRETPHPEPRTFTPRMRPELRMTADEVAARIGSPTVQIVDARDEGQYTGKLRRGPRGGHIPGAIQLPREALIGPDGLFKQPDELEHEVSQAGLPEDKRAVAYCNGGVAATTVLFTLSMLGRSNFSNYDGSWNEWSGRFDLPVEAS